MIAVLGPAGTFSHELALALFGEGEVALFPPTRRICAEGGGGAGEGLVPIENGEAFTGALSGFVASLPK